jgi:hypothetical protein
MLLFMITFDSMVWFLNYLATPFWLKTKTIPLSLHKAWKLVYYPFQVNEIKLCLNGKNSLKTQNLSGSDDSLCILDTEKHMDETHLVPHHVQSCLGLVRF